MKRFLGWLSIATLVTCSLANNPDEVKATATTSGSGAATPTCQTSENLCGSECVDFKTNAKHCGNCETVCSSGQKCAAGKCVCSLTGTTQCGNACIDLTGDAKNCGKCANECKAPANASAKCDSSTCGFTCTTDFKDCNAKPDDGCEINTASDKDNCGDCKKPCMPIDKGEVGCEKGACSVASCKMGFGNCDNDAKNGCETDLSADPKNCGMCAKACGATQLCVANACIDAAPSCKVIKAQNVNAKDGVYLLDTDGPAGPKLPYKAYCEMTTDKGGWEVMAYIRNPSQWDWPIFTNSGTVGDTAGGFVTGQTMAQANAPFLEKIIIYKHLVENGQDLGQQWMVNSRTNKDPVSFNGIVVATGWDYRDSYNYVDSVVGNVCSHGCTSYRGFGMFHDYKPTPFFGYCGTQTGDYGCPDGNNICWMPRSMGCNVGAGRCASLVGANQGVIYGAR